MMGRFSSSGLASSASLARLFEAPPLSLPSQPLGPPSQEWEICASGVGGSRTRLVFCIHLSLCGVSRRMTLRDGSAVVIVPAPAPSLLWGTQVIKYSQVLPGTHKSMMLQTSSDS